MSTSGHVYTHIYKSNKYMYIYRQLCRKYLKATPVLGWRASSAGKHDNFYGLLSERRSFRVTHYLWGNTCSLEGIRKGWVLVLGWFGIGDRCPLCWLAHESCRVGVVLGDVLGFVAHGYSPLNSWVMVDLLLHTWKSCRQFSVLVSDLSYASTRRYM